MILEPYEGEKSIGELLKYFTPEMLVEFDDLVVDARIDTTAVEFSKYKDDPIGFGVDLFNEFYTPDQIRVAEAVRDFPITIAESSNAVGKTHIAARVAVWWYKTRDYAQVYTAAAPPIENLIRLLWGEIYSLTIPHKDTVFKDDRINHLFIAPLPGSQRSLSDPKSLIAGVPIPKTGSSAQREAAFSGKHAKYLLFILDEGDAIPFEVYRGIESCLSGGTGRLLVMYNPRSNAGPIAEFKARGVEVVRLSAFDHPNVITGEDRYPGAVTRNKTLHRMNRWTIPVTDETDEVTGYGRFVVPDYLTGIPFTDEETTQPQEPIPPGERIITEPEFCYMVLGIYPGQTEGVIFDTWVDDYDSATENGRLPQGNVTLGAEFEVGAGEIYWGIDDGYAGTIDMNTRQFTIDSHPRVILKAQLKNGVLCIFDELAIIRQPRPEVQIDEAASQRIPFPREKADGYNTDDIFPLYYEIHLDHPDIGKGTLTRIDYDTMSLRHHDTVQSIPIVEFAPFCARAIAEGITMEYSVPRPEFVATGPGMATITGLLRQKDYFTRTCMANVEESIKHMRSKISLDENGVRHLLVHPRCSLLRYEAQRYKRDPNQNIIKGFDHALDAARYLTDRLKYETEDAG